MTRCLFLSPGAFGVNGGIGLYNRDIVEAILANDHQAQIRLIPRLLGPLDHATPADVQVIRWGARGKLAFAVAVASAALKGDYDFVLCGHINLLTPARMAARRRGCPLILMVYGIDVWERPARDPGDLSDVTAIWSISDITTQRMNVWANLPVTRYVQLPNAIHLDRYAMGEKPSDLVRSLDVAGHPVVLTLTRLPGRDRHKGVDEMLEAMPDLLARHPGLIYVVAGDGPDRPRLEDKARQLGVASSCRFVGFVPEARKADYFRLADVFALPGRGEGFGFVFLEALACGIPCLGSSVDGSKEALRDGMLGELVDPDDRDAIVAAVSDALAKPKEIPGGLAYFDWPHFVERVQHAIAEAFKVDATT